ncbi:hypothetical protein MW871_14875 [Flavobacterium sp. I-SCBP12n]|uniref:Uncharacterized protein n=1 Tax=Flavobacterium pygoscelis TaxID=2893176 RepID=A0A9X2BR63_9FLAO|nr:hypothetical protein [Flavobacterium pygoscelis]MCK8143171.1 hypothetical protein [Flavobacterium pygoscelis]
MAQKFCKLFEVQEHQVLFRNSTNDDGEEAIIMTTQIEGLEMSATMTGFEENNTTADEQFEKIDQLKADSFFISMSNLTQE